MTQEQFIMNLLDAIQNQLPTIILIILGGGIGYFIIKWFVKHSQKESGVET